ncbi:MAG: glycoside hydrolase family 11 protein [Paludibacteraceae bacterium]|nr:glycoside hydrolase family 11 protein [Paludibacteraceae bacterium]
MKKNLLHLRRHIMSGVIMATALLSATTASAVDPCSMTTSMSGGQRAQNGGTHDIAGGFNYEMWTNSGNNASMEYTSQEGMFQFKANWNNPDDLLCRIGLYWGTGPKPSQLDGDLHCEFNYEIGQGSSGGGYNYIGIYGWTKVPNEVEYYIVENTFFGSTSKQQGLYYGANSRGTYSLDGDTYEVFTGTRTGPSISGNSTFTQVFAVRKSTRKCGHISISEHMREWEKRGWVTLGQLYDCKFLCEVGSGSGSFDLKYGNVWIGDSEYVVTPPEPTEPEEPYKGVISIPGVIEAENYDKGGNRFGYYDTDDKNEGGEYRNDGVDIEKGGTGYAIGHTTTDEWLKYTVKVEESGKYDFYANTSNGINDVEIIVELDDKSLCTITGDGNGGNDWDTYNVISKKSVNLSAGEHTLKIKYGTTYCNIDYLEIVKEGETPTHGGGDQPCTDCDQPCTDCGTQPITGGASSFFDENGAYFGPDCDNGKQLTGAYYTGDYTSPFKTYLGKSDEEIQSKLDKMWQHYFENGSNKVYTDKGNGEAYILDTGNNDVRSEGMSYGMMICVQTNHKDEFAKLWKFAKNHMWHNPSSGGDGYFSWQVGTDGGVKDRGCAPDGEMYFMMSLLFAANRWNDAGYMSDAQAILKACWKGNDQSLFNEQQKVVTFQPSYGNKDFSDPSYDLPAFVDLFSRWSTTNNNTWKQAAEATRNHLYKSSNSKSGLFTDYNNFDGTPKSVDFNSNSHRYMYDAMRCAMNFGMDYYLFGADATRQEEMARRIIDFFESDNYQHGRFDWDGSNPGESYTLGETGANAVACYALIGNSKYQDIVKKNFKKAWDANLMTGQWRYYDGLVHYLSMLHLCGSFKIWKPAPDVKTKTVEASEYNGVSYTEETTIDSFEDCQLYKVTIKPSMSQVADLQAEGISLYPNPASNNFSINSKEAIETISIINMMGQVVYSQAGADEIQINLAAGTYLVKVITVNGEIQVLKLQVK